MAFQQRWQRTFRSRPYLADSLLAIAILLLNLSFLTFPVPASSRPIDLFAVLLITVPNFAIVLRRSRPVLMLFLVLPPGYLYWVVGYYPTSGSVATMMVLVYSVPLYTASRRKATQAQIVFFLSLLAVLVAGYFYAGEDDVTVGVIVVNMVGFQMVWIAGETLARRRASISELKKQVRLEQEKQQELAVQAVVVEQNRIARELHDIVAHSMSVVIVQAQGATRMVGKDNTRVEEALGAIESTGRQTLTDIRGIVGLLRSNDENQPTPSLEMIEDLVDASRHAGLPTELTTLGERRNLPMMIELSAYRIVQESLTNARKHAGPNAEASVEIDYLPHGISIKVADTGRGAASYSNGSGFGLVGIRERVEAFGGQFEHGPRTGGGYRVTATLPVEAV